MRMSINVQILVGAAAGVALGVLLGALPADAALRVHGLYVASLVGGLFIALLKMVLVPLVFSSIVVGIAGLRKQQNMQRVWVTTLLFYLFTLVIAVVLGLLAANVFRPGADMQIEMFADAMAAFEAKRLPFPEFLTQFVTGLFQNPFASLVQGAIVPLVVFALILGVALVQGGERYATINRLMEEMLDLSLKVVGW